MSEDVLESEFQKLFEETRGRVFGRVVGPEHCSHSHAVSRLPHGQPNAGD